MDELTDLAVAGATALVTQMATDGWAQVRGRVAAFFARRRGGDEAVVQGELERSRADLVAARDEDDEATVSDIQDEWTSRLRRTLRNDPQAVAELRALLDEVAPDPQAGTGGTVTNINININTNTIGGGEQNTVTQANTVDVLTIRSTHR